MGLLKRINPKTHGGEEMKKKDIEVGEIYIVKVSGVLCHIKVLQESPYGGWTGKNLVTNKTIRIKTAKRFRRKVIKV